MYHNEIIFDIFKNGMDQDGMINHNYHGISNGIKNGIVMIWLFRLMIHNGIVMGCGNDHHTCTILETH